MSILFHVTPRRNLESISEHGIDPRYAVRAQPGWFTDSPCCWFCTASRRAWAVQHVAARHGVQPEEVVILRVSIPPSRLVRRRRGLYTSNSVVRSIVSIGIPAAA